MQKKNKIKLWSCIAGLCVIGIVVPSVLYCQAKSYTTNTNNFNTQIQDLYAKELNPSQLTKTYNEPAKVQYDALTTYTTPLIQLINGDLNVNNGDYLLLIGNQLNLSYQALVYNNFSTTTYLDAYTNMNNSVLFNSMDSIGWNIPIYSYVQFPSFADNEFKNSQLGLYEIYQNYSPLNAKSPTIADNLYVNLIDYAKKIWNNDNANSTLLISYVNGKATFWNQKEMSSFLSSSSNSSSSSSSDSSDPTNGGSQLPTNPLTSTTKQNIVSSYSSSLNSFLKQQYNSVPSSSSSSSSSTSSSTSGSSTSSSASSSAAS